MTILHCDWSHTVQRGCYRRSYPLLWSRVWPRKTSARLEEGRYIVAMADLDKIIPVHVGTVTKVVCYICFRDSTDSLR